MATLIPTKCLPKQNWTMNKLFWVLIALGMAMYACTHDPIEDHLDAELRTKLDYTSPTGSYQYYIFPESDDYSAIPNQDVKNPITEEKVALGKLLFHETALAASPAYPISQGTYSCASCHIASSGFTPGAAQGIADGGLGFGENRQKIAGYEGPEVDAQGTRPLSVLNVAYVTNALWSGSFGSFGVNEGTEHIWEGHPFAEINEEGLQGLEAQNIEGLDLHRMEVTAQMLDEYGYRELYDAAFPDFSTEERYGKLATSFALAAYLRTLFAQEAPFQKWLSGDANYLTNQEKRGALLFLGKARCISCHKGPSFNAIEFHCMGTSNLHEQDGIFNTDAEDERNLGREFFTGDPADANRYKVPQLYNLKDYSHFFHGSSKQTIEEVVDFKIKAASENANIQDHELSPFFHPVDMEPSEIEDLIAFLANALHDPNLERYVPEEVLSGNCIPNNDYFSRLELGCE